MLENASDALVRTVRSCLNERPEILDAYLFGSTSRGEAATHSDLDVAVFIDESRVGEPPFGYRSDLASHLSSSLGRDDIDVVVLNRAGPLLYQRVLRDGVRILSRDLAATTGGEGRTLSRYCDYLPQLRKVRLSPNELEDQIVTSPLVTTDVV